MITSFSSSRLRTKEKIIMKRNQEQFKGMSITTHMAAIIKQKSVVLIKVI